MTRIGSLFSGYGGLDMAAQQVFGGELAWYADCCKFDKDGNAGHHEPHRAPCSIMAHHHPAVPNLGDVSAVDWSQVEPVDVLTGGSPCQDLSHAGKRQGMTEGTRSNLWVAMREAIAQIRPSIVVWENVRGAYSAAADSEVEPCAGCVGDGSAVLLRALGRVLGDLSELGYDCRWHGLRAADVGAPHGRFRVFVIAYPAADAGRVRGSSGRFATSGQGEIGWAHGSSSGRDGVGTLLPTPSCSDTNGAGQHGDEGLDLRTAVHLMPTPRATDGTKGGPDQRGTSGDLMLPSAVAQLLPTPVASEGTKPSNTMGVARRQATGEVFLTNVIVSLCGLDPSEAPTLLPTPAVNDMGAGKTVEDWDAWTDRMKAEHGNGNGHGKSLSIEAQRLAFDESRCVGCGCPEDLHDEGGFCAGRCGGECGGRQPGARLLPTPSAASPDSRRANKQGETYSEDGYQRDQLGDIAHADRWGDYAAAIARWEAILGRPAPGPTQTSAKGNPQLSAAFVEWMMGLPAGHVTDVPGITRNEALKALGNGVVPQQAEAALRLMLGATVAGEVA